METGPDEKIVNTPPGAYLGINATARYRNAIRSEGANFWLVFRQARDVEIREKVLGEMVRTAEEFLAAVPLEAWGIENEHAVYLVRKATARFRLDTGQPVNSEQLALLSGLAHQSIKNRLGGATKELEGRQSRIEAREALAWLASRKDFLPSLWRQQDDSRMFAFLEIQLEDAVFVPVANDGSMFTPNKKKDGYFFVGLEGHERRFEDYEEALAVLQKMPVPSWRRPTEGGTWTRVKANGWARVLRSDLPPA